MKERITADRFTGLRGRLRVGAPLARLSWFRTGGAADLLFEPEDEQDLKAFCEQLPDECPLTVLGVGSNLLVRDGGVEGAVIRLGKGFASIDVEGTIVTAGAGAMDVHVAKAAGEAGVAGLEFLVGVPGTLGGAVRMNAGAYGRELKDVFVSARVMDRSGTVKTLTLPELDFQYRKSALTTDQIVTEVRLTGAAGDPAEIKDRMRDITRKRSDAQPIGTRTGGSTFKNPGPDVSDLSAWQLVDQAGCRGLTIGGAMVSEKHTNFLINTGAASAHDIETLGETVRQRVLEKSGVLLSWEIKRIGRLADNQTVTRAEEAVS